MNFSPFLEGAVAVLKQIHHQTPFDETARSALSLCVESTESDHGSFIQVDWESNELDIVATSGDSWTKEMLAHRLKVGAGLTGKVAQTGKFYYSDDVRIDPNYVPLLPSVVSELCVPVSIDGRVWGIINLDSSMRGHYSMELIQQVSLLSELMSSALSFRMQMEKEKQLIASLTHSEKLSTVGQLIAGIAHEINNPLAAVVGTSELLSYEKDEYPDIIDEIEVIHQQSKRAGQLVKQLLRFSRLEEDTALEPVSATLALREAVELVRPQLNLNDITVETWLPEEPCHIRGDTVQLQQILVNLMTNAKHAVESRMTQTPDYEGIIAVEVATIQPNIVINVRDNGTGMDKVTQKKIFQAFFSTKNSNQGTGLGLAICSDIVKRFGGQLNCKSELGVGTEFSLTIPKCLPTKKSIPVRNINNNSARLKSSEKLNLLIVEDESPIQKMLRKVFQGYTNRLIIAGSAEDALQSLDQEDIYFDWIVSDLHLPGIDGLEFRKLVAPDRYSRFMLMTGNPNNHRVCQLLEEIDVLPKPFELKDIVSKITSQKVDVLKRPTLKYSN